VIFKTDDLGIDAPIKDVRITFQDKNSEKYLEIAKGTIYIVATILSVLGYISLA
jgi:hypothetical protein